MDGGSGYPRFRSSSAIVTKLLVELKRLKNPETSLILGTIVLEDLFLALYLAALAPILGTASGAGEAALLFLRALAFLIALGLLARHGRKVLGRVISAPDDELLVVLFVGFALLVAGIAYQSGVSDAIGAFMAGLVLSGTVVKKRVEKLVATDAGLDQRLTPFVGVYVLTWPSSALCSPCAPRRCRS